MTRFTSEPEVIRIGETYLRIVGPTYICFDVGLALFFAAQGAGRVLWPFLAITGRLVLTAAGVWATVRLFEAGLTVVFGVNAVGFTLLGLVMLIAFKARLLG